MFYLAAIIIPTSLGAGTYYIVESPTGLIEYNSANNIVSLAGVYTVINP